MTKSYCDRCGKEHSVLTGVWKDIDNDPDHKLRLSELCPSCIELLKEWLKNHTPMTKQLETNDWEKTIVDELVTYSGQTFSNSFEAHAWLTQAFYRVAEKARLSTIEEIEKYVEQMHKNKEYDDEESAGYMQAINNILNHLSSIKRCN